VESGNKDKNKKTKIKAVKAVKTVESEKIKNSGK